MLFGCWLSLVISFMRKHHEKMPTKWTNKAEASPSQAIPKKTPNCNQQTKTFIFITLCSLQPIVLWKRRFLTDPQPTTAILLLAQQNPLISIPDAPEISGKGFSKSQPSPENPQRTSWWRINPLGQVRGASFASSVFRFNPQPLSPASTRLFWWKHQPNEISSDASGSEGAWSRAGN